MQVTPHLPLLIAMSREVVIEAQEGRSHPWWEANFEVLSKQLELSAALAHRDAEVEPGAVVADEVRDVAISSLVLFTTDDAEGSIVEPARSQLLGDLERWLRQQPDE